MTIHPARTYDTMNPPPLTYTARARIGGLTASGLSSSRWGLNGPMLEVELSPEISAPITFNGTLAFNAPPADLPMDDPELLIGAPVEVTVRLMVKRVRVVAWKQEEVPLGCWLRCNRGNPGTWAITAVTNAGLHWVGNCDVPFQHVADHYDHSTDGGKTWKAAGRVEEVYE